MKKLLFAFIPIMFTGYVLHAQSTFPTDGSNVGIGTTSPTSKLQITEVSDSKPNGILAPTKSVFKLSRWGTPNYSYPESAEFRIGHGGSSVWGSQLDLFLNGGSNTSDIPDQHAMTWLYNGNVGIGTTSPNAKLSITSSGTELTGSAMSNAFRVSAGNLGNNQNDEISLGTIGFNALNNIGLGIRGVRINSGNNYPNTAVVLGFDVDNTIREGGFISLRQGGNVGIGTINPGAKLDILNSVNGSMSLQAGANGFGQAFYYAEDTRSGNVNTPRVVMHLSAEGTPNYAYGQRWYLKEGKNGGPAASSADKGTNQLIFSTATAADGLATPADVMTLVGNGNVGIGTTNPSAALQLGDFGNNSSNQLVIPGTYNFEQMRLGQIGNGNMAMEFVNHTSTLPSSGIKFLVDVDHGAPGLQLQYAPSATSYSSLSYTTGLYMNLSGNVAIGTTAVPSGYKLAVAGNAIAESMTVKLQSAWPDYVFKKDRALMPLADLKAYVDKNQHLPEIPSAAEVEKNGQDLGEMNKLLVKKMEEMTLYMIEKDKQIKDQQAELKAQDQRLKNLEQQIEKITKKG